MSTVISVSDFMLNGRPLGTYTIAEVKKICRKNKKEICLHSLYNLTKLEPEEAHQLYLKIVSYFVINFKYKGQIFLMEDFKYEI